MGHFKFLRLPVLTPKVIARYTSNIKCQCKSIQFAYRDECFPNWTLSSHFGCRNMVRQSGRSDLPRRVRVWYAGVRAATYTILCQHSERKKPAFAGHGTVMPPAKSPVRYKNEFHKWNSYRTVAWGRTRSSFTVSSIPRAWQLHQIPASYRPQRYPLGKTTFNLSRRIFIWHRALTQISHWQ